MGVFSYLSSSNFVKKLWRFRFPYFRQYAGMLAWMHTVKKFTWVWLRNVLFFDQMIRLHCNKVGENIFFWGTYPLISNNGYIEIGDDVRIIGSNNIMVGFKVTGGEDKTARLVIRDDVTIGFGCEINVASSVYIGSHVRFATGVKIFDNNSHPTDARLRREKSPMTLQDIAPIVIEDDVWIGINAVILKGVVIGEGAIVAAGSVVTKSIPPNVIAAGNPARIVKSLQ
ncbi:MAG TPA: acyltransferase [Dissulfurispiraceae bacterium]|nr:acyltransferase [Dissulfurispiraceae bacterium]